MLLFCLGPALQRTQSYASATLTVPKAICGTWSLSLSYVYLIDIHTKTAVYLQHMRAARSLDPLLHTASREMSLFTAAPRGGMSYTIPISVCLAYPDRTNSSLLGMLAQPSARPQQAQQLFHGMNAHTLSPISSGSLPLSFHVPFMLFILLSCIVSLFWFFSAGLFVGVFLRRLFVPLFLYFAQILPLCLSSFSTELQCLQILVISKNYPFDCLFTNNCNLVHKNEPDYSNLNKYSP